MKFGLHNILTMQGPCRFWCVWKIESIRGKICVVCCHLDARHTSCSFVLTPPLWRKVRERGSFFRFFADARQTSKTMHCPISPNGENEKWGHRGRNYLSNYHRLCYLLFKRDLWLLIAGANCSLGQRVKEILRPPSRLLWDSHQQPRPTVQKQMGVKRRQKIVASAHELSPTKKEVFPFPRPCQPIFGFGIPQSRLHLVE